MSFIPFKVRVPATTANLGAGFDCLGLALSMWNELEARPADRSGVRVEGEGRGTLREDDSNLVCATIRAFHARIGTPAPAMELICRNSIPLARGLGSSAAARIAALVAANRLAGGPLSKSDLLQIATEEEGHPDNVAPALLGGLVVCGRDGDKVVTRRIEPAPGLRTVVLIPEMKLETAAARKVLPQAVPHKDAVHNLQNTALTTAAFLTGDYDLLRSSLDDRLHQPYRKGLIPGFDATLAAAVEAGAYGAALSGAGPALIAFTGVNENEIAGAMSRAFIAGGGGPCLAEVAEIDLKGAVVEEM